MTRKLALLCILALCAAPSCSKPSQNAETAANAANAEVSDNAGEIAVTENCNAKTGSDIQASQWADASNALALEVLKSQKGNAVASAFGAQRALGMVLDGACGETAAEMRNALALPNADNLSAAGKEIEKSLLDVHDGFSDETDENGNPVKSESPVAIEIDNKVWVEKTYKIRDAYKDSVKNFYNASFEPADFIQNHEDARKTINSSISDATRGRIQNILPPGSLDPSARLVLTNAVYFKAPWAEQFKPQRTVKADFMTADGPVQTDMMQNTESFGFYQDDAVQIVALGFYGCAYDFVVFLPKLADGQNPLRALSDFENALDAAKLRALLENIGSARLELSMPKFRIEASANLKKLLSARGMTKAFGRDADFSAISGAQDLFISDIFHKAFIEIDEAGAEAAAATAAVMLMKASLRAAPPIKVSVDRPFMFAIVDRNSSTALFMGRKIDFK